ncbi:MAG: DUF4838 domain-containing protein [Planctomycetota bacterium]
MSRRGMSRLWLWALVPVLPGFLAAAELKAKNLKFVGGDADQLAKALDNDLGTWWESDGPQTPGMAVVLDLGRSAHVYSVYLTPGRELSKFPRSLNVYVGETFETLKLVAHEASLDTEDKKAGSSQSMILREESYFRFPPAKGRFAKFEIGQNGAGLPWAIAEINIHAATREPDAAKRTAVICDAEFIRGRDGKPAPFNPLKLAAEELQYYLMELTDAPVDVLTPDEAAGRTGLRFRLVTPPAEQVPNPEPDPKNLDDVAVEREGRRDAGAPRGEGDEIRISGPTPRAVLYAAYEFLESQGVRWLYPDPNGDMVPARKGLNLSVLPLHYRPPFSSRGFIAAGIPGVKQEFYMSFLERHRFTMGYNYGACPLGTIPRMNCGFGWAHTMGEIFGGGIMWGEKSAIQTAHPDWWPGPYRKGWSKVPCTSNPEVSDYVMKRIDEAIVKRAQDKLPAYQGFSVHPTDSPAFCECERCRKLFGTAERVDPDGAEDSCGTWDYSDYHFHLIDTLAKRLQAAHPEAFLKTLAYANHERPPKKIARLPDNVLVDICPWWRPLPVDSPQNREIRDNLQAWQSRCNSIGIWSYVLIYSDTTFGYPAGEKNFAVPNARAIISQNRFYNDIGIRSVGTQLYGPQLHWPWGTYAYARTTWRPQESAETILQDFFRGYYGEAWEPMLRWYEALEQAALAKDADTSRPDARLFENGLIGKLRGHLKEAASAAKKWYVKERVELARYDTEWTWTQAQWKSQAARPYACYRFKEAPVIDGKLDDAVWRTVPEMQGFRIAATRVDAAHPGRLVVDHPTQFRMGWDEKYLYLALKCDDPQLEKMKERDAKETQFEYRDLVEIFFAPEAPPYYRQTMVSSAGFVWGPMKIRQVNAHQPIANPDFVCKTGYSSSGWTLEARYPLAMLADKAPQEGTRWPANFMRVADSGQESGERFSSWADIPRYNFHEYGLGTWSLIEFHDAALSEAEAAALTGKLNAVCAPSWQAHEEHQKVLAAFNEHIQGKENLAKTSPEKGVSQGRLGEGDDNSRRGFQVLWSKEPATLDAVRVLWSNLKTVRRWYSLEYWDGAQYRLIEERRDNEYAVSVHEFEPLKTSRLRLTVWADLGGWQDLPMVKAIEAYKR